jgi:hypothetical protein
MRVCLAWLWSCAYVCAPWMRAAEDVERDVTANPKRFNTPSRWEGYA